jgi:dipeptide transport system permease protein
MSASEIAPLPINSAVEPPATTRPGRSWSDRLAPLWANKIAVVGGFITLFFFIIACIGLAIMIVPGWDSLYIDQRLRAVLVHPLTDGFLLGTDNLGRSMAWRIAAGTAVSLFAGVLVTILSMTFGMLMGAIAG